MTQSVLTFTLQPGARDAFLQTFTELGVLETSSHQAGYRGSQLHIDVHDPDVVVVTAQWASPAAYHGWLDSPARDAIGERLRPFCAGDPQGRVVELVHAVAAPEAEA